VSVFIVTFGDNMASFFVRLPIELLHSASRKRSLHRATRCMSVTEISPTCLRYSGHILFWKVK